MYDPQAILRVKQGVSITAVAERLGLSVRRGRFRCPHKENHAHGDRTPSVSISEERQTFRCWVCPGFRGDVIALVQKVLNLSFGEALKWLRGETVAHLVGAEGRVRDNGRARRPAPTNEVPPDSNREAMIADFLELLVPVDGTPAKKWLMDRRIFKPTWDSARLRFVGDYPAVHQKLLELYPMEDLQGAGLFSANGKLVFYKHPLVIPYLDHEGRAQYFQARAIEKEVRPKELNLRGPVPFPYNEPALDGKDGFIYLCEGAIDTLTVLNRTSYSAVGIPGAGNFRSEWAKLFANKKVTLCLDGDEAGRKAAGRIQALLAEAGVTANIKALPDGEDINSWFGGR